MKVLVVYYSGTGNTEAMAAKLQESLQALGNEVICETSASFNAADIASFDAYAFGCPAMGDEVLEESEFQPLWDEVKANLGGKKAVLFGSWGWGAGVWMESWEQDAKDNGVNVVKTVMCQDAPDDAALEELEQAAKELQ